MCRLSTLDCLQTCRVLFSGTIGAFREASVLSPPLLLMHSWSLRPSTLHSLKPHAAPGEGHVGSASWKHRLFWGLLFLRHPIWSRNNKHLRLSDKQDLFVAWINNHLQTVWGGRNKENNTTFVQDARRRNHEEGSAPFTGMLGATSDL